MQSGRTSSRFERGRVSTCQDAGPAGSELHDESDG